MDQTDPWQVVSRQVFTPYDCLLISVAFVVLCRVGCLLVIDVYGAVSKSFVMQTCPLAYPVRRLKLTGAVACDPSLRI